MYAEYDAIVYDLDGTLVQLDVDWDRARREVRAKLRARGHDVEELSLWEAFDVATEQGLDPLVHETLADHERQGARTATRLSLANDLPHEVPTGVCSLNAEAACRIALELHGLDGFVEAIVGRDTLDARKPDPKPLVYTCDRLGVSPANTVFIGDSRSDRVAAERAGMPFLAVEDVS